MKIQRRGGLLPTGPAFPTGTVTSQEVEDREESSDITEHLPASYQQMGWGGVQPLGSLLVLSINVATQELDTHKYLHDVEIVTRRT